MERNAGARVRILSGPMLVAVDDGMDQTGTRTFIGEPTPVRRITGSDSLRVAARWRP
jgi:hypothetical protein